MTDSDTQSSADNGDSRLPLRYIDGPDYCTVKDATDRDFALTVQPEFMKAMERALSNEIASLMRDPAQGSSEPCCPFCGRDPFHYVDIGVGMERAAVVCCDLGDLYFRGAREAPEEVTISWEDFTNIGSRLAAQPPAAPVESVAKEAKERWLAEPLVKEALHRRPVTRSSAERSAVIEECAQMLEREYPDNANTNAFCAAIRALGALNEPQTAPTYCTPDGPSYCTEQGGPIQRCPTCPVPRPNHQTREG